MEQLIIMDFGIHSHLLSAYSRACHCEPDHLKPMPALPHSGRLCITQTPVCWTLMGRRRDSWIVMADPANGLELCANGEIGSVVRDMFGYQIKEDTWVMILKRQIQYTKLYYTDNLLQQVAYPHSGYAQHNAILRMMDSAYDCVLQSAVCVRSVQHFVHLWQRQVSRKILRKHARHVLLLVWCKKLPLSCGHLIYESFSYQARTSHLKDIHEVN